MHLPDLSGNSLNEDNKVSLFVRYIDIADTENMRSRIVNKNSKSEENRDKEKS